MKQDQHMVIRLTLVVLISLVMCAVMITQTIGMKQETERLLAAIEVSRNAWQATSSEKQALQAELRTITANQKEAGVTLDESTVRAGQLQADIAELEESNMKLKQMLETADNKE